MEPKVKILFCSGVTCSRRLSLKDALLNTEKRLQIFEGDTTSDGIFLGRCTCQNQCEDGGNVRVEYAETGEAEVHNQVTPEKVKGLLEKVQSKTGSSK